MRSDVAISVKNLTKTYRIFGHPGDRIKQALSFGRARFHREYTALQDVSFEIKKGETVGIIGRNGSGKSTLLQLICGILKPTSGSVEVNGRISALLELGAGFNPEFTGRENVYFQGAVLGFSRYQMDERIDDIIAFADIGEFIDEPVRTYSSGMFVRLAFAVIAYADADILIIDEALAVGDVFFQQKCMRYLRNFQNKKGTILFVSHDTGAVVGLCEQAILLSPSADVALVVGSAKEICQIYVRQLYSERTKNDGIDLRMIDPTETVNPAIMQQAGDSKNILFAGGEQPENTINIGYFRRDAESFGRGGAKIIDAWFEDKNKFRVSSISGGIPVSFCIKVKSFKDIKLPAFGFTIKNYLGQYIFSEGTDLAFRQNTPNIGNGDTCLVKFSFLMPILIQGDYSINVAVAEGIGDDHIQHYWIEDALMLHSMKSRLIIGTCGLHNLNIGIEISRDNRSLEG